MNNASWKKKHT